jgi:hypothetical protein
MHHHRETLEALRQLPTRHSCCCQRSRSQLRLQLQLCLQLRLRLQLSLQRQLRCDLLLLPGSST